MTPSSPALALLLLADGRFPAGGHAHSHGIESAVGDGRVDDIASLEAWLRGRMASSGLVDAALAAATLTRLGRLDAGGAGPEERVGVVRLLDAEAGARLTGAPRRLASRRLGRQLWRVGARCWPGQAIDDLHAAAPDGAHQPVALGATCRAAGLDAIDAARLAIHHSVATGCQAAVRLLGLDPFATAALQAGLAGESEGIARSATAMGSGSIDSLPTLAGPIAEVAAIEHATADSRLFAT